MGLFPFMNQEQEINPIDHNKLPREYDVNFDETVLTGKVVDGAEAIKLWVMKVLRTKRYKYVIYTWDYGIDLEDLINKNYDRGFVESEVARNIEEALKINPHVKGISGFRSKFEGTWLSCEFTVVTDFGEVNISEKYPKF